MWYRLIKMEISHRINIVLNNALAMYLFSMRKHGGRRVRVSEHALVLKVYLITILFFIYLYLHITSKEFYILELSFTWADRRISKYYWNLGSWVEEYQDNYPEMKNKNISREVTYVTVRYFINHTGQSCMKFTGNQALYKTCFSWKCLSSFLGVYKEIPRVDTT